MWPGHSLNLQKLSKHISYHSLNLQTLRGVWNLSKIFNGKLVDVLINPANNIVLATRTPGDFRCEKDCSCTLT
jgi:hypothetical protein